MQERLPGLLTTDRRTGKRPNSFVVKCDRCGFKGIVDLEYLLGCKPLPVRVIEYGEGSNVQKRSNRVNPRRALRCTDNWKPFACELQVTEIIHAQ